MRLLQQTLIVLGSAAFLASCGPSSRGAIAAAATAEPPAPVSGLMQVDGLSPNTITIFSPTTTPANMSVADAHAVELGIKFISWQPGWIDAIRFFKGSQNRGPHVGHIWNAAGTLMASVRFRNETPQGWQQANLTTPLAVRANMTYTVSYHAPAGYYSADPRALQHARYSPPLTVPPYGGAYAYGDSGTMPQAVYNASSYGVDLVFRAIRSATKGDLASVVCIGALSYRLDDHDWFDRDAELSVSDAWPEAGGAEWSNRFGWGRGNNSAVDQAWYPAIETLKNNKLAPVAALVYGSGVALRSYREPPAIANTPGNHDFYFSGMLSNSKAYATGYWVFSAQLPGGSGWFPALWLISESGGAYWELDAVEQWGPTLFGPDVVVQSEPGSPKLDHFTTLRTSNARQHSYGALVAPNYVGFYIDGVPVTKRLARYETSALNPVINLAVCRNNSWCGPEPAAGATAEMLVRYYAHYSPVWPPAPCAPTTIATPAP